MEKKRQLNVLVTERNIAMLKQAAKAYRAPSLNWFVGEMLESMLNPALWHDFQTRLNTGAQQLTLALPKKRKGRK